VHQIPDTIHDAMGEITDGRHIELGTMAGVYRHPWPHLI
jgi:hypothetical protein